MEREYSPTASTAPPSPTLANTRLSMYVTYDWTADHPSSPPSRPSSALSGGSSFTNSSAGSEDEEEDHIPRRRRKAAIVMHENKCLLCGGAPRNDEDLDVIRILAAEESGIYAIPWLKGLRLIDDVDFTRNDLDNLLTLCELHGEAYVRGAWCFVPSTLDRAHMIHHEQEDLARRHAELSSGTPNPLRTRPQLSNTFEVVVVNPYEMPLRENSPDAHLLELSQFSSELKLNPFVIFATSLDRISAAQLAYPNPRTNGIEVELLRIRGLYNSLA